MMPIKSQIRHAVVERLKACSLLQARIFDTPLKTFDAEQLPLVILTVEKDQVLDDWTSILMTTLASNALIQMRELSLNLMIVAKATPTVVNELNYIAAQIMSCLLLDRTLDGLCKNLRFQETTEITTAEEAEKPVCSMVLHSSIWYRQIDSIPEKLMT
jgi:hypothetical protein